MTQSSTTDALTQLAAEGVWLCPHNSRRRLQSGQTGHHLKRTASEADPVVVRSQLPTSRRER